MQDIKAQILPILKEYTEADLDRLLPEDTFASIGIDSLSLVEIIFDLEEHFEITIPPEADLEQQGFSLQNLDDIVNLVSSLCQQKND
ncbi:MAG: phosphopantetheine-binding protein [Gammaproteobacteria bacterium]|nr:MAG: phosphopantetheine-binding protein [Gammaproteobacteria bacterium]